MIPELHLGPLTLQSFGLMLALSFVAAGLVVAHRLRELGRDTEVVYEAAIAAVIGGLVGGRFAWLAQNWEQASGDLIGNALGGAGLTFYGGLAGGVAAVAAVTWYRGALDLRFADAVAPAVALAYAIGRIGCQLSGDGDYGVAWDGPWAMAYPDGTVPIDTPVHPTPIYETLAMSLLAYGLWRLRDRVRPGVVGALYLVGAGIERFAIELIRRNEEVALGLTLAQWQSVAMVLAGAVALVLLRQRAAPRPATAT